MSNSEIISQAINALHGNNGWIVAALTWIGTLRLFFKLISASVENLLKALATWLTTTNDQTNIVKVNAILSTYAWRVFAFLADYIASIKLPLKL
jgi:Na+/H+ antiporter NhaD/arsenite permease-like protein